MGSQQSRASNMAATATGMEGRRCSEARTADGTREGEMEHRASDEDGRALRTVAKAAAAAVEQIPAATAAAPMCTAHTQNAVR